MRTPQELLRIAVGAPEFSNYEQVILSDCPESFTVFHANLPLPEFRGLPPTWTFIVVNHAHLKASTPEIGQLAADARVLVDIYRKDRIVIVCDLPNVHLSEEFDVGLKPIFCLDDSDLPRRRTHSCLPKHSPFILAVKRRLTIEPEFVQYLSPYQRSRPVSGWQFFGREAELKRIVSRQENVVIVGARRTGKTSLMQEAQRRLEVRGEDAYYVNVSNYTNTQDVIASILRALSPRLAANAARHGNAMNESALENALRRLTKRNHNVTLFLDEMGNVLENLKTDAWSFLGVLRNFSQQGRLRIVISCFQEAFLRQQSEFSGPLVNFGVTMRLGMFDPKEVKTFVLAPLEIWKSVSQQEESKILTSVSSTLGGHPYFLQCFCTELFDRVMQEHTALQTTNSLLRKDILQCFSEPTEEVFHRIKSVVLRYLFLTRCREAHANHEEICNATLDEKWVAMALQAAGFTASYNGRRNLLEGLEVHGLSTPVEHRRAVQTIAIPAVYLVVKRTHEHISDILDSLQQDFHRESEVWDLSPNTIESNY